MTEHGKPALWKKEKETLHADCRIYKIYNKTFSHPIRKQSGEFFVMEGNDWALCLPVRSDGKILLVRQYRFGSEELSWEIPGGCMEKGENPITSATRELTEETGYTGSDYLLMGSCSPNPALQKNRVFYVLANNVESTVAVKWDEHEELEAKFFSLNEIIAMIQGSGIYHALTINAVFYYQNFHLST